MPQSFIRLRAGVFADAGYCLQAPALTKTVTAYFCVIAPSGKPKELSLVPGTAPDSDDVVSIPLLPYADQRKAAQALHIMCATLADAIGGDALAREVFAEGWKMMLMDGLDASHQDNQTQIAILCNLFGTGRIYDALNRTGTLASVGEPDWPAMLDEALAA